MLSAGSGALALLGAVLLEGRRSMSLSPPAPSPTPDLKTTCEDRTKEYEVNLNVADFTDRMAAIADFRAKLEELEDSKNFSWFKHKGAAGRDTTQFAGYLDLSDGDLLSSLNIRYRRVLAGKDVNKSDFAVKYKEAAPFYPNLKPMTASAEWEDAYKCKVEDNFKYFLCPHKACFPAGNCDTPCPELGPPGFGLEFQEQAPKIKGDPDERFSNEFTSVEQFQTVSDITQFFPNVADYWQLGDPSTALSVSKRQYRWIHDNIKMEFDDVKVECGFTLWYTSLEDLNAGTVAPERGFWSFSFDADPTKEAQAKELLEWVATMIPSVLLGPAVMATSDVGGGKGKGKGKGKGEFVG